MSAFDEVLDLFRKRPTPRGPFGQRPTLEENQDWQKAHDDQLDCQKEEAKKEADKSNSTGDF